MANVTFNGATRIIQVNPGVTALDVQIDIYSDWKEWMLLSDNSKWPEAIRSVGGDPVSSVKNLGATYFLMNGWRIRPYEGDHRLMITGNLYTDPAGESPVLGVVGYSIIVEYSVSSLVDSTLVQLEEMQQSTYDGCVTLDVVNGVSGQAYPIGTNSMPSNNLADAKAIASSRSIKSLCLIGDLTLQSGESISDYNIHGKGATLNVTKSKIVFVSGCVASNVEYDNIKVEGVMGGEGKFDQCVIGSVSNAHCRYTECALIGPIVAPATVSATHTKYFDRCYSSYLELVFDHNTSQLKSIWSEFLGIIKFQNCTHSGAITRIDMSGGQITIDASCTAGLYVITGTGTLINNSGGAIVDASELLSVGLDGLKFSVETARQTHQAFGRRIFLDPVSGRDTNLGFSDNTAFKTWSAAHNAVRSGAGDTIILMAPGDTPVTLAENLVVSKTDVHVRGPGRGMIVQAASGLTLSVTGDNCSFSGFVVKAPVGSTIDDTIVVESKFSRWEKIYQVGTQAGTGCGIVFKGGDYHELIDFECEKNGGDGLKTIDAGLASGSPREISVKRGNFYLNGGHGINFTSNSGAAPGTSTRINRVLGANCHDNTGFGIAIDANTLDTLIDSHTMIHNNVAGEISDVGINTTIEESKRTSNIVNSVWDEVIENTHTGRELMRGISAALMGKILGAEGTAITIRDLADTKNRIAATVDESGNRITVTLDLS